MPQTPAQIAEFLDKLNDDDNFRNELVCDPAAVFTRYNISFDPKDLPQSQDIKLPPKGEVAANLHYYASQLFPNYDFASNDLLIDLTP